MRASDPLSGERGKRMSTGNGSAPDAGSPAVLLVDGMSVLVRAAKAARRIRPLSHEGTETGTLMMFIGTLANHLASGAWDYVVVAWEGVPELNWRREFYPEYKSNRPARTDDATAEMSRDEELAREFCAAAGLRQDWAAQFEGDDVIAAWWRVFRRNIPEARIAILTSDRDLLQLCDEQTQWRAWANEVMTAADVYAIWGVQPERLPLLRALAGDASDGIPGVPGIGPVKAAAIAGRPGEPLAVLHDLAAEIGVEPQAQAYLWYMISELREPAAQHFPDSGRYCEHARWQPGRAQRGAAGVPGPVRDEADDGPAGRRETAVAARS